MGATSGFFLGMAVILLMPSIAHFVLAQNDPSDWVAIHNSVRRAVGVGPVSWDVDVAAFAESYASQQTDCKMLQHSGTTLYGENIFRSGDPTATASDAMLLWAGEAQNFNFNTKTCAVGAVCGHYTQVVWRDSTAIGCARSACGGGVFMTCNYSPPGNIKGQDPF